MITLGTTAPSTAQAGGVGRMFAMDVVLAGAPAGSYFQTIRAKLQNTIGSGIPCRAFVYSGTSLVDWVAFTLPTGAGAQIVTANLTGAVVVTNGTYKIGVQMNPSTGSDANFFITSGTADTTSFTSTTTYGSAPPNPWTPGSTFAWTSAFAADVFTPSGSPPVAGFSGTPTSGAWPLIVAFTDSSTNTPTSWAWTFGDGGTSTSQNPSHTYAAAGTYTVALTATNASGSNTMTRTGYVTVANPSGTLTKIKWGTGLAVTDEGAGVIRADATATSPVDATSSAKGIVQLAGDLTGTAASPQIAAGVIVDADVNAANKDGTAATPSLRTLGTGAQQAAAGNDSRLLKAAVAYGTSLPASPVDGQEAVLVDSTTNPSFQWQFRYNAGSSSAYKWEFVGGAALLGGPQGTASAYGGTAWAEVPAGPRLTVPRAGDYLLEHGCYVANVGSAFTGAYNFNVDAPLSVQGPGPNYIIYSLPSAWSGGYSSIMNRRTNVTTGQYFYVAGQNDRASMSTNFSGGWLSLLPLRVS